MPKFKMMRIQLFIGILFSTIVVNAQEGDDWKLYKPTPAEKEVARRGPQKEVVNKGEVKFIMDSRISRLDSLKDDHPSKMDGYRVQLFFGDKSTATRMRAEFLGSHPGHGAYISYLAPNFRLRVGDFRTKLESEQFKNELDPIYKGTYIVQDKINLPPLED